MQGPRFFPRTASGKIWAGYLLLALALLLAACDFGPSAPATPTLAVHTASPTLATTATVPLATSTVAAAPTKTTTAPTSTTAAKTNYNIGILQTSTHPSLDLALAGIKQGFASYGGLTEGIDVTFDVRNAELDTNRAAVLAQAFIAAEVDAIVTIGTLASVAALAETQKAGSNIPIIFCAVADAYAAKLAGTPQDDINTAEPSVHPANLTGVQAFPLVFEGMRIIGEAKPGIKRVGLLWNPQEPISAASTSIARGTARNMGLELIERPVTSPADTVAAAEMLADLGVEAFFVSTTNSVVNGLDGVVMVAQERQIPVFANDPLLASRGAVAAAGLDYTINGIEAAEMAVQILTGKENIATLDIKVSTADALCVNTKAATQQGVILPDALLSRAGECDYGEAAAEATATP